MKRLIDLIKKLFSYKFIRFLFAGGLNTLFSYAIYALFVFLIKNVYLATTLEIIIAVAFNYMTSSRIVFREKKITPMRIIKFYGIYFITYVINLGHLYVTVDLWGWNEYLAQLATLVYLPFISFALQRLLIFKDKNKEQEGIEDDHTQDNKIN